MHMSYYLCSENYLRVLYDHYDALSRGENLCGGNFGFVVERDKTSGHRAVCREGFHFLVSCQPDLDSACALRDGCQKPFVHVRRIREYRCARTTFVVRCPVRRQNQLEIMRRKCAHSNLLFNLIFFFAQLIFIIFQREFRTFNIMIFIHIRFKSIKHEK